jgi:hypothetical protein
VSCPQLQRLLTEVLQTAGRNAYELQSRGWQSSSQACVVIKVVAAQVCVDRFGGVLGVDHPEQVLRFPVGRVCWASTGVTTTTTAAVMATTLSSPLTGSAAAPTASRTTSASLGVKKEANGDKREKEKQRERSLFLLLVCLPHRNFTPTGIHELSNFTHHFLGK